MPPSGTLRRSARLVRSWLGGILPEDTGLEPEPVRTVDEVTDRGVSRRTIEALVGVPVRDLDLYEHALRHRSLFRGLQTNGTESNERLEFLGDAVLGTITAEVLYRRFPDRAEGLLTRTRATLVNGKALAGYATAIGLDALVLMSDNMEASDGRQNATILADSFEAIVGAIYLDLGFDAADRFVRRVLDQCVDLEVAAADKSNHKSRLLEYVQGLGQDQPIYVTVSEEGPSHARQFTVAVVVEGEHAGEGSDRSKKGAEQIAAREALKALREQAAA
ncbi:ribonuclease III [Rubrivirga sp.]|uniref:ribonuclease III n=1 Tax=Rubrivirga sp. TaxID=1885344 RepID=UPI003C78E588